MKSMNNRQFLLLFVRVLLLFLGGCLIFLFVFSPGSITETLSGMLAVLKPFLYGFIIAYLLHRPCQFLERWIRTGLKKITGRSCGKGVRTLAALLSVLLGICLLILLLVLILPQLVTSITSIIHQIPQAMASLQEWLNRMDQGNMSHEVVQEVSRIIETLEQGLEDFIDTSLLPHLTDILFQATSSFLGILSLLKNIGLGCIAAVYLLTGWEKFLAQGKLVLYGLFPSRVADWILQELRYTDQMFSGFISGKVLDSLIIGIICFLFMSFVRMPYALLISLLIGITNIIPFFGPYIGAIPSALLLLMISPVQCLVFLVFILILQQVDGNILGPKILGSRMGVSGFWVLFAILVFGSLWGFIGMLIGVPVFAVLYDLFRQLVLYGLRKYGSEDRLVRYQKQFMEDPASQTVSRS